MATGLAPAGPPSNGLRMDSEQSFQVENTGAATTVIVFFFHQWLLNGYVGFKKHF